ncbi:MAG TPA: spore germination protein GerW family protein [Acidimicrobiia bacterium]|nr:spore germination protein GerW family protein [Acidimicrobiia bacterium]
MSNGQLWSVLDKLDAVKDTLTVGRVFGDAYEVGGTTIIPVASVQGGGGGGGGEGPTDVGTPVGGGVGFGVKARPVGVYIVKEGHVSWQPALDLTRVILAGQFVGLIAILTVRKLLRRR